MKGSFLMMCLYPNLCLVHGPCSSVCRLVLFRVRLSCNSSSVERSNLSLMFHETANVWSTVRRQWQSVCWKIHAIIMHDLYTVVDRVMLDHSSFVELGCSSCFNGSISVFPRPVTQEWTWSLHSWTRVEGNLTRSIRTINDQPRSSGTFDIYVWSWITCETLFTTP